MGAARPAGIGQHATAAFARHIIDAQGKQIGSILRAGMRQVILAVTSYASRTPHEGDPPAAGTWRPNVPAF